MLLRQPPGGHELKEIRNTLATLRENLGNTLAALINTLATH
jgi:hypothetical protein